jgi:hypothetical protein
MIYQWVVETRDEYANDVIYTAARRLRRERGVELDFATLASGRKVLTGEMDGEGREVVDDAVADLVAERRISVLRSGAGNYVGAL